MTVYRRRSDSDEWHWQPGCPHYPTEQPLVAFFVEAGRRPWEGRICPECLRLEEDATRDALDHR